MRHRDCAGGVVFFKDKVFLIKNEKGEWILPKGVIRNNKLASDVAVERVKHETGIMAKILAPAGETRYEFFSVSRRAPVSNRIDWFIMEADEEHFEINKEEGFLEGGFFSIEEGQERITYSQDRSLVRLAYEKYKGFKAE